MSIHLKGPHKKIKLDSAEGNGECNLWCRETVTAPTRDCVSTLAAAENTDPVSEREDMM